jgi:hypothetical protein
MVTRGGVPSALFPLRLGVMSAERDPPEETGA